MFREVQCQDVSVSGFSYLVPDQPDYEKLVVTLGDSSNKIPMIAAIVRNCMNVGSETEPLFRVGCEFGSRLSLPADAAGVVPELSDGLLL